MKQKLDETGASMTNTSLIANCPQPTSDAEQPAAMASSLPRHLNDSKNVGKRMSRYTEAATSCEEILMTVHTNKGTLTPFIRRTT